VVGLSNLPGDMTHHPFLWQNGVMTDLGTLPGDVFASAHGINTKGQVVGGSGNASGNLRAFLWRDGVMTDLNTLNAGGSSLFLLLAEDINARGQITGFALQVSTSEVHGFWRLRLGAKPPAGARRPRQEVRAAKGRRWFFLRMFASCSSNDSAWGDSDSGY
jgi:probable HAF family extracellular repeat protein